jgi:hypothetical protein
MPFTVFPARNEVFPSSTDLLTSGSVFIRVLSRNTDVDDATTKVRGAVDRYIQSICSLSATIGVHLLENQEELLQLQKKQLALLESLQQSVEDEQRQAKKEKVLKWLYDGDPWERYSELKRGRSRFANSGTWFLESPTFREWFTGYRQSLICWGARTSSSLIVTDLWLAGAGKSFITFV